MPLPKWSFAPPLIVPRNLRILNKELKRRRGSSTEKTCEAMAEKIKKYKEEIEEYLEWFEELLRIEDQLKAKDPLASILHGRDEITIKREDYEETMEHPMRFIRRWIKKTTWDKQGDFIRPLVMNLRAEIKEAYLS